MKYTQKEPNVWVSDDGITIRRDGFRPDVNLETGKSRVLPYWEIEMPLSDGTTYRNTTKDDLPISRLFEDARAVRRFKEAYIKSQNQSYQE